MMNYKSFSLENDRRNIKIVGGRLNEIGSEFNNSQFILNNKHELLLLFTEDTAEEELEAYFLKKIKSKSKLSYLKLYLQNHLGSILTILVSVLIVVFITLLSVHGSLTYDLFSGNEGINIFRLPGLYIYLLLSILILTMLYLSPKIIFGEYHNLLQWAESKLSSDIRIRKKLLRELKVLLNIHKDINQIIIYNPLINGIESWVAKQFLPVLSTTNTGIHVYIKADEKSDLLSVFKNEAFNNAKEDPTPRETEQNVFPVHLLSNSEKECLKLVKFCSLLNLPDKWNKEKRIDAYFSSELAILLNEMYGDRIYTAEKGNAINIDKFINRCIHDYGYLHVESIYKKQKLIFNREVTKYMNTDKSLEALSENILSDIHLINKNISNPLSNLIILGFIGEEIGLGPKRLLLIESLIANTIKDESYDLLGLYWDHFSKITFESKLSYPFSILQFLNVKLLNDLAVCFFNSGNYDHAREVYRILKNIYPAKAEMDIADMEDSRGFYAESLELLYNIEKEWIQAKIIENDGFKLVLYLNIAWVIVSGRFMDKMDEGYSYLNKVDSYLNKLPNIENHIMYKTRYYNTLANYKEWNEEYGAAIENYEKALDLPGSILRKSSLLVNRGISERLLGKMPNKGRAEIIKHFETSKTNISQGVNMKKSIGENNGLPGSYHNLAETLLNLASAMEKEEEKIRILNEANEVASSGLDLLNQLNSARRRGRLLTEKYIAIYLLKSHDLQMDVEQTRNELREWIKKEEKDSFDYREVQSLLSQFSVTI
ncbi:MAG: hypothetical protein KQH67_10760 [Bacteroidetes bacterium]|nr:hypothetical protein [Bacteroidota bacterium]